MEKTKDIKTAIIFIGIPASGKTSYFQTYFQNHYVHINLDTLHTRGKEMRLLMECLENGKSFVVDNTNPSKNDRKKYIDLAKEYGYRIEGYFFKSVISECIDRNELRIGKAKVVSKAIAAISNKLEIPNEEEGFDGLYFVSINNGIYITENWRILDEF